MGNHIIDVFVFVSVEDPFEPWYDVAHVLKTVQMSYLKKEFIVSSSHSLQPIFFMCC